MTPDVQLPEPAAELLRVAADVTPPWMRRVVTEAAARGGVAPSSISAAVDRLVGAESSALLDRLFELLATDVDEQRANPLDLFRGSVRNANRLLDDVGAARPPSDAFRSSAFPDDPHQLGPASWGDIDQRLHEPGLTWGAWKAMTVLRRRRDEGLR